MMQDSSKNNIESLLQTLDALQSGPSAQNDGESQRWDSSDEEHEKYPLERKYSEYGYDIYHKLKESQNEFRFCTKSQNPWKSNSLTALPNSADSKKYDVYAEPVFGLRIVNPAVSSQFIQSKMIGRQAIPLHRLKTHLTVGDKNIDWVFAGVLVSKTGIRTSQKGSQYCLWEISDLKADLKRYQLYLFSRASSELWKIPVGTAVAVLNAANMQNRENEKSDDVALMVRNPDQVMVLGTSKDFGICRAKKKNGEDCTAVVNKGVCEFCIYHIKREYNKFTGKRSELSFGGNLNLKSKVLGKTEVFYGGKSYTAMKPSRDTRQNQKDKKTLSSLFSSSTLMPIKNQNLAKDEKILNRLSIPTGNSSLVTPAGVSTNCRSRMQIMKDANEEMKITGEPVRISASKIPERKTFAKFSEIFGNNPDVHSVRKNEVVAQNPSFAVSDVSEDSKPCSSKFNSDFKLTILPSNFEPVFKKLKNPVSFHKMKLLQAKQTAVELVKKSGGLTKEDPNSARTKANAVMKRPRKDTGALETSESSESSVVSKRFVDLMNTESIHSNLVTLAEELEEDAYFNRMEQKERLEEKMLSTYKIPCKAVKCCKCKYTWFSASDLCKAESHLIKVVDAMKRFFKCSDCGNRTVSLDIIPLTTCKKCGSSKWIRAPMMKEKLVKMEHTLSICGDEETFLNSNTRNSNLDLLVPE